MKAETITRKRTYKVVTVSGITTETDREVSDFAIAAASETRSSLFGTYVTRNPYRAGIASVQLNTD